MRYIGLALAASAFVLSACAGGDKTKTGDTTAAAPAIRTDTGAAATPGAAPATTGTPAATTAGGQPATGAHHRVQMVVEGTTYKFVPADITVKAGDAIDFVNASGGPHNVAFKPEDVPDDVEKQLDANMPNAVGSMTKMGPLSGPLMTETTGPNSTYTISFAGIKPGKYPFHCTPHEALGMKGTITVQ